LVPLLVFFASAAFGAAPAMASPRLNLPRHRVGKGTSTNWSGYAVDGTAATHVLGSWTATAVTCQPGENSWSSPWVGIDGDTSNTVEQTGTDSDCVNGQPTYYAWYEMYPKQAVTLKMPVHAGDTFTGEVTYSIATQSFALKLTDSTTGATFTTTQSSKKAQRSSVEWVVEGPSNGGLSNFGSLPAGGVTFTATNATISSVTGPIGSFSNAAPITMVNNAGATRAQPTTTTNGTSFSVNWVTP
jgi:hypothetical protein